MALTGRKKFDRYQIGYLHIGLVEVRSAEGKLEHFVAIGVHRPDFKSSPSTNWSNMLR